MWTKDEVRETFLSYFRDNDHNILPDKGLIPPSSDESALFINSGVHALKGYLFGDTHDQGTRLASNQSCIRTIDIDRVGYNNRTLTFFNMLGSWSIGDYWKEGAIEYAHGLLTERFGLDPSTFAITVFGGDEQVGPDEESAKNWEAQGIPRDRIYFVKGDDNWWKMADTGPQGPCTEVFIDRGEQHGPGAEPGDESPRFVEIWNAGVFTEFYRHPDGSLSAIDPKVIDTGAGLERIVQTLNDKDSVFGIEPYASITAAIRQNMKDGDEESERHINMMADHLYSAMKVSDTGVIPSNKGRGYVLRRLLRKPYASSHLLGVEDFKGILDYVKDLSDTPNVHMQWLTTEYDKFSGVLNRGLKQLDKEMSRQEVDGRKIYDIYQSTGLPPEVATEYLAKKGLHVDMAGYDAAREEHKQISREGSEMFRK